MKRILLAAFLIVFSTAVNGSQYFTNLRSIDDVSRAIEYLVKSGDFGYFAAISSESGVGIHDVTSNIREKDYIFCISNREDNPSANSTQVQNEYIGQYLFKKSRLKNIAAHKKNFPNAYHYNLSDIDYQAISIFDQYLNTTYRDPVAGKYIISYVTYKKPFLPGESGKYLEVSFRGAAGGDTASFIFIKEKEQFRLKHY